MLKQLRTDSRIKKVTYISPEQGLAAFKKNTPFGSAIKLFQHNPIPGVITVFPATRNQNPETIDAILQAYFKGLDFWKANSAEANAIIAKAIGSSVDEVAVQLEGIDVLNKRDNQTAFTFAGGFESLYGNMRRIGAFIQQLHYPDEPKIDTDKLIDNKFFVKFID